MYGGTAPEDGQALDSLRIIDRRGDWEGVWVAGRPATPSDLQSMCRPDPRDDERVRMPPELHHKHCIYRTEVTADNALQVFDRYACATAEFQYKRHGGRPAEVYVCRTLPLSPDQLDETRKEMSRFFDPPTGIRHERLERYGEFVGFCRSSPLPQTGEAADAWTWLLVRPMRREHVRWESSWQAFAQPRYETLVESLNHLSSLRDAQLAEVARDINHARLYPTGLQWRVRHYFLA